MSDARRYAVWPEPRSRSRSLKGSRPSVPHGTNFRVCDVFRRIFPTLQFSLEGLEKARYYSVCVDVVQVGNSQWKYHSSRWMPSCKAQRPLPSELRRLPITTRMMSITTDSADIARRGRDSSSIMPGLNL